MNRASLQLQRVLRRTRSLSSGCSTRSLSSVLQPAPASAPPHPIHAAPLRVTLDTNPDDCNFSCTMCEQHSVFSSAQVDRAAAGIRKRRMEPDTFEAILAELAPRGLAEVIPSTMGEPLMYAHFERLVAAVAARPGLRLNLTTNGSFYPGSGGHSLASWARLLLPVLSDVKISWNGATATTQEAIMRGSKLNKQLANLAAWIAARDAFAAAGGNRASVTLQLTFMATNLREIPDVVRLAIAHNVDRVKGHHLWAHFAPIKGDDLRASSASVAAWNACVAECRRIADAQPLPSGRIIKLENFVELNAAPHGAGAGERAPVPEDADCPFLGREAWVNHKGDFAPCCAPDAERRSLGDFGNVREPGGLLRIWASPAYAKLVATYKTKPLCSTCQMRKRPVAIGHEAPRRAPSGRSPEADAAIVDSA